MTDLSARKGNVRGRARHAAPKAPSKITQGAMSTLPILLVGSMAMTLNMTSHVDTSTLKRNDKAEDYNEQLRNAVSTAMAAASPEIALQGTPKTSHSTSLTAVASVPSTYRVSPGDTVSSIAAAHGLSTASVLALNGLGWKSLIFPGQVLQLTKAPASPPATVTPPSAAPSPAPAQKSYTIKRGDTISAIASRFGVSTQAILTVNQLGWSTIIYPGQKVVIPGTTPPTATPNPAPTTPPATTTPAPVTPPVLEVTPVSDVTPIPNAPTPAPQNAKYLIKPGDTVTSIASKFGVSVQSILNANGLQRSSIIYTGRTLIIPGATSAPAGTTVAVTPLTSEMATNARTIIAVGTSLGVSDYGLVIALATAMQESSLRNLNYGDRDSLGLFQQRPSTGWGSPAQVTDPVYASKLFFGGPSNPNKGRTRGLLDIPGWQSMTLTRAAQAVQISGYPNAYAKWEHSARAWLIQLR